MASSPTSELSKLMFQTIEDEAEEFTFRVLLIYSGLTNNVEEEKQNFYLLKDTDLTFCQDSDLKKPCTQK